MNENNPENLDAAPSVDLVLAATDVAQLSAPTMTLANTVLEAQQNITDRYETLRDVVPIARQCIDSYVAPLKAAQAALDQANQVADLVARMNHQSVKLSSMVRESIAPRYVTAPRFPTIARIDVTAGLPAPSALLAAVDLSSTYLRMPGNIQRLQPTALAFTDMDAFQHQKMTRDSLISLYSNVEPFGQSMATVSAFAKFGLVESIQQQMVAMSSVRTQMHDWLSGLGETVRSGSTLAKALARWPLMAALRARDAALRGDTEEVDGFIRGTLNMRLTPKQYWLRDAVVSVLLENDWLPDDVGVTAYDVVTDLRKRVTKESRNHKLIGDTEVKHYRFDYLDRQVRASEESTATVGDLVVARSIYSPAEDIDDPRLERLTSRLNDDEQAILRAYSLEQGSWGDAAREQRSCENWR
jgi:hypothetical protein